MQKKHRDIATANIKKIPRGKLFSKVIHSILGIGIAVGGAFLPGMGFPWWVGVIVIFVGGWTASKDLVKNAGNYLLAFGKDATEIWRSK